MTAAYTRPATNGFTDADAFQQTAATDALTRAAEP